MKKLSILAFVMGLGATAIGLYHLGETASDVLAIERQAAETHPELLAEMTALAWAQVYTVWILAAVSIVLGTWTFFQEERRLGLAGTLLGLSGLVASFFGVMNPPSL